MTWAAHRMSQWLVASIVALIPIAAFCAEESVPEERVVQTVQHGAYTFNVHSKNYGTLNAVSRLEVVKNGVVLAPEKWKDWFGRPLTNNEVWVSKRLRDVTGNGTLDVIVGSVGGGTDRYKLYYIFELGRELRYAGYVSTRRVPAEFVDLDGKPGLEVRTVDDVFAHYSKGDQGVFRPPTVVMRFVDGKYEVALDLMRMPRQLAKRRDLYVRKVENIYVQRPPQLPIPIDPSPEELAAFAREVRDIAVWRQDHRPIPLELTHMMWNLIYAGEADRAVAFFHAAWPDWRNDKDEFFREFYQCQLRASDYWPAIAAMNGLPAEEPVGECPGPYD